MTDEELQAIRARVESVRARYQAGEKNAPDAPWIGIAAVEDREHLLAEVERLHKPIASAQPLARQLWTAEAAVHRIEEQIGDVLDNLVGDWSDFATDPSDESIEIFGVPADVTLYTAGKELLRALGFRRAWLHQHESLARQAGERAYVLGDAGC